MKSLENKILVILSKNSMGLTELSAILRLPRKQVFKQLKKLFIKGKIEQKGIEYFLI